MLLILRQSYESKQRISFLGRLVFYGRGFVFFVLFFNVFFLHSNTSKLGIIIPLNFNALKGCSYFFDMKENVHGVYVFFKLSNGYSIHLTVLG